MRMTKGGVTSIGRPSRTSDFQFHRRSAQFDSSNFGNASLIWRMSTQNYRMLHITPMRGTRIAKFMIKLINLGILRETPADLSCLKGQCRMIIPHPLGLPWTRPLTLLRLPAPMITLTVQSPVCRPEGMIPFLRDNCGAQENM